MLHHIFIVAFLRPLASSRVRQTIGLVVSDSDSPFVSTWDQRVCRYWRYEYSLGEHATGERCQQKCIEKPESRFVGEWCRGWSLEQGTWGETRCQHWFLPLDASDAWSSATGDCWWRSECRCTFPGNQAFCGIPIRIQSCSAVAMYSNDYRCEKAYDGNLKTDWATRGWGETSWIQLNFAQKTGISQITITQRRHYGEMNKEIELIFDDDSRAKGLLLKQSRNPQTLSFPLVMTNSVKIWVHSVYGTQNNGFKEISFGCTGGINGYHCDDGQSRFCASNEYCYSEHQFNVNEDPSTFCKTRG